MPSSVSSSITSFLHLPMLSSLSGISRPPQNSDDPTEDRRVNESSVRLTPPLPDFFDTLPSEEHPNIIIPIIVYYERLGRTFNGVQQWNEYAGRPNANSFVKLIKTLENRNVVDCNALIPIVDAMTNDPVLCGQLFQLASEIDYECHYQPLLAFNTMQEIAEASCLIRDTSSPHRETKIFSLVLGQFRQKLLADYVKLKSGASEIKEVVLELLLRFHLSETLNFPFPLAKIVNEAFSNKLHSILKKDDFLRSAVNYVMMFQEQNQDWFATELLATQPTWTDYLRTQYSNEIEKRILETLYEFEVDVEETYDSNPTEYETVQLVRQQIIDQFLMEKTVNLLESAEIHTKINSESTTKQNEGDVPVSSFCSSSTIDSFFDSSEST